MSRTRGWCFTLNNYTPIDELEFGLIPDLKYYVYGREVGEQGTPHLQGYLHFNNKKSLRQLKHHFPTGHFEPRRGSINQAVDYCKKDGDFTEWGEKPCNDNIEKGSKSKERWEKILSLARNGDWNTIMSEYPGVWVLHQPRLRQLVERAPAIIDGDLRHEWWYGQTGTGKSRKIWQDYPIHFQKQLNKWWDGYNDEEIVVVEEWSPKNECTGSMLKVWGDRYPFTAEIKGGTLLRIRPKKIIVTSNYTIEECFQSPQDSGPLKRRFKQIHFVNV